MRRVMSRRFPVKVGDVFGKWTVVKGPWVSEKDGHRHVLVRCECGLERDLNVRYLASGESRSCGHKGCAKTKHGLSRSGLYNCWWDIKRRCYDKRLWCYPLYGGEGKVMCDEWRGSFQAFADWALANGWKEGLTIERIDNTKGYSPDNCRWATRKEQGMNRRSNRMVEFEGRTQCLQAWIDELGLPGNTVRTRLRRGWPIEEAFFGRGGRKNAR